MDPATIVIIAAAFFFAAFVKGATGLGFSTTCLPFLVLAIGLKETLPLLIVPSLASNALVMIDAGHFCATVRRFWPLFLSALPGVAAGLALLAWVDPRLAAAVLGAILIGYCLFTLLRPVFRLDPALERPLAPLVGFLTGTVNGLTGSQVMPVLPYLFALQLDPNRFVQAINCSFSLSSLAMAVGLANLGIMTWKTLALSVTGLIPVYLGVSLGNRVRRRLSGDQFRKAVLVLLLVLGAGLIVRLAL